jgi:threonyl-tRNA synthetase
MKLLSLHCDYIEFKPLKKALKEPEKLSKEREKEKRVDEVLVILTAVEKGDESDSKMLDKYVENIEDLAKQVKAKNIVLYPYAHLSSSLSNPDFARKILEDAEKKLKKNFSVVRAPFGYYKEFELKCKGHPLAELSRSIGEQTKAAEVKVIEDRDEKADYKQLLSQVSKTKLDTRKLKDNDHRILGQKLDLFSFNETAPGMVFWHNNGLIIRNELINFWREQHKLAGYKEILTPQILDKKLWLISGHWDKYKENIFLSDYEGRTFAVKPMNCPGGMLIYKASTKSYKDFPLRVAELGVVHRQELSGVLAGLFRVIQFTQDDAHIFCTEKQIESEIEKIIELIDSFYKKFNLKFDHVELSTRPEKRIGDESIWDLAESTLEKVLKKKKMKYKINEGDGVFYGPKIDFHVKDSLKRTWQCSTIQLDFAMPERFDLKYTTEKNTLERPVMLHRVIYGSLERFIGILLEHTNGHLPLWLSPVQLRVVSFTDRNIPACREFIKKLGEAVPYARVDADFDSSTVNDKVRNSELQKIPIIVTIGDKEEEKGTLAVRERGKKVKFNVNPDEFIKEIKERIDKRL